MKYQYIKFVAVVSNVYYRYDMITSVHAELQTNRQYFLKRNYKSFWMMYNASSGRTLSSFVIIITVQRLSFACTFGKMCTLHCSNRPQLCSIQVASKLVQTTNLVDIYSVLSTHERVLISSSYERTPLGPSRHKPCSMCDVSIDPLNSAVKSIIWNYSTPGKARFQCNLADWCRIKSRLRWYDRFCRSWTRRSCCGGAVLLPVSDWVTSLFSKGQKLSVCKANFDYTS